MTAQKKFSNPEDFRRAIDERLRALSKKTKVDIQILRRQVAFDRFLARLFSENSKKLPWALKGGYAMELRIDNARTTKDLDLALRDIKLTSENAEVQNLAIKELLAEYASKDLNDFFIFRVGNSILDIEATPYGGGRFPIEATVGLKLFASFQLDVGVGDVWIEPLESLQIHDWLSFVGIEATNILAISPEQQFSEKFHAYTLPRSQENTRVKDLVDMGLLIKNKKLDSKKFTQALDATFKRRKTHDIPLEISAPPASWAKNFVKFSEECALNEKIDVTFEKVKKFIDETRRK